MSIEFACASCGKRYAVGDALAGKRARCRCGTVNQIPAIAAGPARSPSAADATEPTIGFQDADEDARASAVIGNRQPPPMPVRAGPMPPPLPSRPTAPADPGSLDFDSLAASVEPLDIRDDSPPTARPAAFGPAGISAPQRAMPAARSYSNNRIPWSERGTGGKIVGAVLTLLFVLGLCARALRLSNLLSGSSSGSSSSLSSSSSSSSFGSPNGNAFAGGPAAPRVTLPSGPVPTFPPLRSLTSADWPSDATLAPLDADVRRAETHVRNAAGLTTNVTVYLPTHASSASRVPCVFIAPAGSRLFHGMALENGDTPEHLPYAHAGFAVVAYSVGGPLQESDLADDDKIRTAFAEFRKSQGGYADAEAAIAYALATRPEIDPQRLYVAGHSSAATIALLVASKDARIKGCCAYAPATDLDAEFKDTAPQLESALPGFTRFVHDVSPMNLPGPKGSVLIFHADDDDRIPSSQTQRYADRSDVHVTYVTVHTGGHFQSMMDRGIPEGVRFLKRLAGVP